MGKALSALVARYRNRISALTDTDSALEAEYALECFEGAAGAYETAAERGPVQYSVAGRSFSFENKAAARDAMEIARADLLGWLSADGGTTLVDMGGSL